jgi:hypothetical protein
MAAACVTTHRRVDSAIATKLAFLLDSAIATKLATLRATHFEVTTHVGAILVDCTSMLVIGSSMKHAATMIARSERHESKMAGLETLDDVQMRSISPAFDVVFGDEDGTRPLKATGTTG